MTISKNVSTSENVSTSFDVETFADITKTFPRRLHLRDVGKYPDVETFICDKTFRRQKRFDVGKRFHVD